MTTKSKKHGARISRFFYSFPFALILLLFVCPGIGECHPTAEQCSRRSPSLSSQHETTSADLPLPAQAAISAALGRDNAAYHITATDDGYRVENIAQTLTANFSRGGVRVETGGVDWGMRFIGYGYGDKLQDVAVTTPEANANRVEFRHRSGIVEWYVNGPLGLEQGFTINHPPNERAGGPLTLALVLSGNLDAKVDEDGKGLSLQQAQAKLIAQSEGATLLHYGGLMAFDAKGKELHSWLELREKRLLINVDDSDAQYPITIDPTVQGAKLTPQGTACYQFGRSVAITASSDVIVVGADEFFVGPGSAYVFVKPPGGWTNSSAYAAKLRASDGAGNDRFGLSVAISSEGNTIAVGALFADKAYVFVKPSGGWTGNLTETARLTAAGASYFGGSVAVSGDTVVVGASGSSTAYVFLKPSGGWATTPTYNAQLSASGATGFGQSVSISGDTVVVGADSANAAFVFLKPSGGWATTSAFAARLDPPAGGDGYFGFSTAISGDTVVVGAYDCDVQAYRQGAAYVYVKPSTGWASTSSPNATLTPSGTPSEKYFGYSVAINGDLIAVGAVREAGQTGAGYLYIKPTGGWASMTETVRVAPWDPSAADYFASSIAIGGTSLANFTMVIGAYQWQTSFTCGPGKAYIFGYKTQVNSIVRTDANPNSASPVHWTVTFESPVTGVTASNFELFGTASSNATISSVTGSGFTRTVTASINPAINGTLGLRMANAIGLDLQFSNLPFDGQSYTMAMIATRLGIAGSTGQQAGTANDLTITAEDDSGNTVTTYTGDKTLVFSGASPSPNPVTAPTVTEKNGTARNFGVNTVITFSSGAAQVSGSNNGRLRLYKAENASITVTDGTLTADTNRLDVSVYEAPASRLLFVQQPTNTRFDTVIAPAITVQLLDAYGNTTASTSDVDMSIANNPSGGTLNGTTTVAASSGVATFSDLSINRGGNGYTLTASTTGMTSATSNAFNVIKENTTTTITSDNPAPSVVGQTVAVNFSVTAGFGTPTGNVTVTASGGSESCTGTVAAGSCSIVLTAVGNRTLTASYAGDVNFNSSTSAGVGHTVNMADTTTTITADNPDPSVVGEAITVNFTVTVNTPGSGTPTGNMTVTDGDGNSCVGTVASGNCTVTPTSMGGKTLTVTYGGDTNFNGSNDTESHQVNKAATTTVLSSSLNPSAVGESVTFTAAVTVNGPGSGITTGTVTFREGAAVLGSGTLNGSGQASLVTSGLSLGSHSITATYEGEPNFDGSTSTAMAQAICNSSITVTSDADSGPSTLREAIANVCPDGTVNFAADYTILLVSQLDVDGGMTIDGTGRTVTVSGNNAVRVFQVSSGTVNFQHLTIADGYCTACSGAGLANGGLSSIVNITDSIFSGNRIDVGNDGGAIRNDGTMTIANSTLSNNRANAGSGGGIENTGTLTVTNCTLTNNHAQDLGGGINNDYLATITGSTFSGNTSLHGASVYNNDTLTVTGSTFSGNTATGNGGAIHNSAGTANITNCTLLGNNANDGGGIFNQATMTVVNATLFANRASNTGGGFYNEGGATLKNTIVASSTNGGNCYNDNILGTISDGAGNLVWGDTTCPGINADPKLDPNGLQSNGGATQTIALLPGSPAIDAVNDCTDGSGSSIGTDQRGITRPQGTQCDIGAFESRGFSFTNLTGTPQSTPINTAFTNPLGLTVSNAYGEPVNSGTVTFTAPGGGASALIAGSPATISGGAASVTTTANGTAGSYNVTVSAAGVASSSTFGLTNLQGTTATAILSSPNPSVFGQTVTFTATVTSSSGIPTGSVTFTEGAIMLGSGALNASGIATFNTSVLTAGTHEITASYDGDSNFSGTTSSPLSQIVNKAPASITLDNLNHVYDGTPKSATATTNPIGLLVDTTYDGSISPPTNAASYAVIAIINDANYHGTAGGTLVIAQSDTTTAVVSSANPSAFGQGVLFTATVTPVAPGGGVPWGTLILAVDGVSQPAVNLVGGSGTFSTSSLSAGSHTISAAYSGDTNFISSNTSLLPNQTVIKASSSTVVMSSQSPSVSGQPITFTATVNSGGGMPTGTVTFRDGVNTIGTGSVNSTGQAAFTTSGLSVGSHSISALYGGDPNFDGSASSPITQTLNKAGTTTAVASSANPSIPGQSVTFTATVTVNGPGSGTPTGLVTFKEGATVLGTGTLNGSGQATFDISSLSVGSHSISAVYEGDGDFEGSTSDPVLQRICLMSVAVTSNADSGTNTLRQAMIDVCDGGTIDFNLTYPDTITLTSQLTIDKNMAINGPGATNLAISANNASRVFYLSRGLNATLDGLTIRDGSAFDGGGILNDSTLNVTNCAFSNNGATTFSGGAITNYGTLTISESTFSENHADWGGSLYNTTGSTLTVTNSTFSGNTVSMAGSNILNDGTGSVTSTTLLGDSSSNIYSTGTLTLTNTILLSGSSGLNNCDNPGTLINGGGNLQFGGSSATSCGAAIPVGDPKLASLGNYGGPTKTIALLPGSPAIDGGEGSSCPPQDQRGVDRVGMCDIGAFESRGFSFINLTGTPQSTPINNAFAVPLGLTVSSAYGEPVSGGGVTLAGPGIGASTNPLTHTGIVDTNGKISVAVMANSTAGSYNVVASAAGVPMNSPFYLTNQQGTTTTAVTSNPNPSLFGQAITFTAAVTSPSGVPAGSVTFKEGTATLGSGTLNAGGIVTFTASSLAAGTHLITAIYDGNANFNMSTSSPLSQVVGKTAAAITLDDLNHVYDGTPKSATATTVPAGLIVNITYNGSSSPPMEPGSYAVVATIIDANYQGTVNGALIIAKANTMIALVSSPNPSIFGQSVTFGVTVSTVPPRPGTPTGTVTFKEGDKVLGTAPLSEGTATLGTSSLPSGLCCITAEYGGDEISGASVSPVLTQTVVAYDLILTDDYGRSELRINTLTGDWSYTILTVEGTSNTFTGTGRIVRKGEILWFNGLDTEGWGLNLVYNETFRRGMATFGDRATGMRSSLIATGL